MAETRPFTDAHAIAMLEIAVFFGPALSSSQFKDVKKEMESSLKREGFSRSPAEKGVAKFLRHGPDDDVIEEVHIHDHMMHSMMYEFRGWAVARNRAKQRLQSTTSVGVRQRVGVGLAVRDIFFNDEPAAYQTSDVFAPNNRFLPASVTDGNNQWKLSFSRPGEIEGNLQSHSTVYVESKTQDVEVESVDAESVVVEPRDDEDKKSIHTTEITHRQWYRMREGKEARDDFSDEAALDRLDALYQRNKALMTELLSEAMLNQIGLKE